MSVMLVEECHPILKRQIMATIEKQVEEASPGDRRGDSRETVSRPRIFFFSSFTPTWMLGALLVVCFFLPAVRGCSKSDEITPSKIVAKVDSFDEACEAQFLFWPYFFGLVLVVNGVFLAVWKSAKAFRVVWLLLATLCVVTIVCGWLSGTDPGKDFVRGTGSWLFAFTFIMPLVLLGSCAAKRVFFAALIVQGVLAAFSFVWFFWGVAATGEELLIGGKLSLLAGGALIVTTVTEGIYGSTILRTDWARRPWRFSMRQLTFATLVAGPALGWIALYLIAK